MLSQVCHDISEGHDRQVLSITLIDELLSHIHYSERIVFVITCNKCDVAHDARAIFGHVYI